MVIAIDGPAGSGKSTVARKLANRLGFIHLNSGALFRTVGLFAKKQKLSLDDDSVIVQLARSLQFRFELGADGETVFLVNGKDIRSELADETVGTLASRVALLPSVRQVLMEVQRAAAKESSLVVEGRDSGTVVFPDAEKKIYLDSSLEVRTQRRLRELRGGVDDKAEEEGQFREIRNQLEARDSQDANREFAPHRRADDATLIDTSNLTPEEVVDSIVAILKK